MKRLVLSAASLLLIGSLDAHAGFGDFLNNIKEKAKETEDSVVNTVKNSSADSENSNSGDQSADTSASENNKQADDHGSENSSSAAESQQASIKTYKNYDFVPGDKIIFESQLADEDTGEIPSQFTLDSGQLDVEEEDGENVIRVPKGSGAVFTPRISSKSYLPDQFTVEFDIKNERFGLAHLNVKFGNSDGIIRNIQFNDGDGLNWATGDVSYPDELHLDGDHAMEWHHIAIAINKNAGKVYVDQYRVVNVNNLDGKAQAIYFDVDGYETSFVKNVRIAAGGINVYKKVTTDGKIVTHGILFDVDKATIKPLSMGAINSIYKLLKKHASLKFEIGGYTDNTGDAKHNLELSKQRADAVKTQLVSMGIDPSRLSAKGFGDTKPLDSNSTPEGRANNRRVEFVKI
jgi:OOP family OmpA-OmpF porin